MVERIKLDACTCPHCGEKEVDIKIGQVSWQEPVIEWSFAEMSDDGSEFKWYGKCRKCNKGTMFYYTLTRVEKDEEE